MLPDPPMTTMATKRKDRLTMNALGSTYCCFEPNSSPARPPRVAPMAKAHSLNLKPATPMTAAASSSSRIASQARPTRLCSRRRARKMRRMRMASASQYQRSASIVLKNARPSVSGPGGTGTPVMPAAPLVTSSRLRAVMRMISPKPSVTMAR